MYQVSIEEGDVTTKLNVFVIKLEIKISLE